MTTKNTGGPAFPTVGRDENMELIRFEGMTLRDYFAAKAMQSFIEKAPHGMKFGEAHPDANEQYAFASYAMADAMLKAREQ